MAADGTAGVPQTSTVSGAATAAPTVGLTATKAGSWVFAVGNDWDHATARTAPTTASGTLVTMSDTAPTNDRRNVTAVEVQATEVVAPLTTGLYDRRNPMLIDVPLVPFIGAPMRKPTARVAIAALAIPLFGGFATYAAAQVSTTPAAQVVIPARLATNAKVVSKSSTTSTTTTPRHKDPVDHDANDDRGRDAVGHDANDDRGQDGVDHDANDDRGQDAVGHDANDDHGHDGVTTTTAPTSPTTVDDHGNDAVNGHQGRDGGKG